MTDTFLFAFAVVMIILLACLVWFSICNMKTLDQRRYIIWYNVSTKDIESFDRDIGILNSVSHMKHCWYLFTFRNPHNLYDPILFQKD